jgi:hypothetical protein
MGRPALSSAIIWLKHRLNEWSGARSFVELIEKLQALPTEKQAEVFDFVEFLSARFSGASAGTGTDSEFSDFSLSQALRGMETDPVTYTADDLSEKWP